MARADTDASNLLGGRYRLLDRLASGGMGDVWHARDQAMDRDVAVKLLRGGLADQSSAVERFRREASTAAALNHPNVARIYDVVDGDRPAIVMELVEGESLARRLGRGRLPFDEVIRVTDAVLAALDAAHAAGIIHRDVTPGNVLLATNGDVKVTDFGIARRDHEAARLTDAGHVIGTAHYLAPEQLRDVPPTPASDQYSAAIVMYEALTGARPFEGSTPAAAALARLRVPPTPLTRHRPGVPAPVADVVMRALERDPSDRFASVGEMRAALVRAVAEPDGAATQRDLLAVAGGTSLLTGPVPLPVGTGRRMDDGPSPRPRRSYRAAFAALALLALLVFVARTNGGAQVVDVPDVKGKTLEEARRLMDAAGLGVQETVVDAAEPEGTVLAQAISPGVRIEGGTAIELSVSSGVPPCCTVPSLVGLPLTDAEDALAAAGLAVGATEGVESELPSGTVVGQDVSAGSPAEPGTSVALDVSVGKDDDDHKGRGRRNRDD